MFKTTIYCCYEYSNIKLRKMIKKEKSMAKCKGCGEEIAEDVMFCPKCGVRQNSSDREANIDKIVANTASVTDDVSSVISDAHNFIKFGKKEITEKKEGASLKSRVVAALLAFFFGMIGVHSFYLGKKASGVVHLLLTIIGIAAVALMENMEEIYILAPICFGANEIWCVISALMLICGAGKDGEGLPVKNWT